MVQPARTGSGAKRADLRDERRRGRRCVGVASGRVSTLGASVCEFSKGHRNG